MFSVSIGPLTISAYTVSVMLAIAAGLTLLAWRCRSWGLDDGMALDAALGGLLLGVIAARAETVITALEYFLERPSLAFCLRQGGLGGRTLLVVLVLTYAFVVIRSGAPWRPYLSALTPALALSAALLWAGALFWGGFAGRMDSSWAAQPLPDQYGVVAPRLPLPAVMSVAHSLLAVWALTGLERLLPAGVSLAFWGASTAALAALLGNFRPEAGAAAGVFADPIMADAVLALVWLATGIYLYSRRSGPGVVAGRHRAPERS